MKRLALCLVLLVSLPLVAAKQREWKTATVISVQEVRVNERSTIRRSEVTLLCDNVEYFGENTPHLASHHGPHLTENGTAQWSLEGSSFYLRDEDGKEFKFRVIKKRTSPRN